VEISTQRAAPWSFRAPGGHVSVLRFESAFTAVNPALRDEYARYRRNRIAWAQHWRHDDGPRPTLCVIHGFGASPYVINSAFFALPWLYRRGFDVLLYLMPFHGPRRAGQLSPNGSGLFAHGHLTSTRRSPTPYTTSGCSSTTSSNPEWIGSGSRDSRSAGT
jgi:hypothetical protein